MRLGVAAALVDGELLRGDVELDRAGTVVAVGLGEGVGESLAVPGLVDLQVNGVADVDLRTADRDGFALAARLLAGHGATAVQPTFHSQSVDAHCSSLARLAAVVADPPPGCRMLRAHLEGPFLSLDRRGAHRAEHLCDPDPAVLERLLGAGPVGMVTLAPELPGALEVVRRLVGAGVVASIGHTDATAPQVLAAVDAGVRHVTHCWNAQRPISARDPGPIGVALSHPALCVGLVADLVHVAAEVVALTMSAAGGRVAVTTDVVAGPTRLEDGTLAGGAALPDECLHNLVELGVGLADAVDACGGVQRRLLGLDPVRLVPGERAEVVVLDGELRAQRTVVGPATFEPA